jgi:hypothetical protein
MLETRDPKRDVAGRTLSPPRAATYTNLGLRPKAYCFTRKNIGELVGDVR